MFHVKQCTGNPMWLPFFMHTVFLYIHCISGVLPVVRVSSRIDAMPCVSLSTLTTDCYYPIQLYPYNTKRYPRGVPPQHASVRTNRKNVSSRYRWPHRRDRSRPVLTHKHIYFYTNHILLKIN